MHKHRHFSVAPIMGHWEIDGKPVSAKEAKYGLKEKARWVVHDQVFKDYDDWDYLDNEQRSQGDEPLDGDKND